MVIDGVNLKKGFQQSILANTEKINNSYKELAFGNTKAMILVLVIMLKEHMSICKMMIQNGLACL